jgi:hypothetical protein
VKISQNKTKNRISQPAVPKTRYIACPTKENAKPLQKQTATSKQGRENETAKADNRKGIKAAANAPGVEARKNIPGYTESSSGGTAWYAKEAPKNKARIQQKINHTTTLLRSKLGIP